MASLLIQASPFYRDTDVLLIGILTRGNMPNEVLCKQADILSLTAEVVVGTSQVGSSINVSIPDCVFDTPKKGTMWPSMPSNFVGFNFAFPVPRTYFTAPGTYKVQVDVVLQTGEHAHTVYQLPVRALPKDSVV